MQGIDGIPYIDYEPYIDRLLLRKIDEEICFGLTKVNIGYSGGPTSHDIGLLRSRFSGSEREKFDKLGQGGSTLSHRQKLYLEFRYGAYFAWKVFYALTEGPVWESYGKAVQFTDEAKLIFPATVNFIESLPFSKITGCGILGLQSNDCGPVHNDQMERCNDFIEEFLLINPSGNRRLFLVDECSNVKIYVNSRACWFNTRDLHGVEADPYFRYSIRIAGEFRDDFRRNLIDRVNSGIG